MALCELCHKLAGPKTGKTKSSGWSINDKSYVS